MSLHALRRGWSRAGPRARLNLWLGLTFVVVFCITSAALHGLQLDAAMNEVRRESLAQMEMALAVRQYVIEDVRPLLSPDGAAFHLPAIPAYAAVRTMALMQQAHPQTRYQELAIDPTNPANRASGWQLAVIGQFNADPRLTEWSRVQHTAEGALLQIARPVRPTADCLACHGTPADAPPAMRAQYGDGHGFGWKVGEAVGMQLVTVPATAAIAQARAAWWRQMVANVVLFVALFVVVNQVLSTSVIAPIEHRSTAWRRLAGIDALTGALNRRSFDDKARAFVAGRGAGAPLTLVLVDIDHFKRINDRHGHDAGDRVLKDFARRMARGCRPGQRLFRLGGEEFALVLPDVGVQAGTALAQQLRRAVEAVPFDGAGRLTASFGVAMLAPGELLPGLMKRADRALYLAKEQGRNRVVADDGSAEFAERRHEGRSAIDRA